MRDSTEITVKSFISSTIDPSSLFQSLLPSVEKTQISS